MLEKDTFEIIGITDRKSLYTCLDGYPFIPVEDLNVHDIDYIIVSSEKYFAAIRSEAMSLGFFEERIILARVFCLPGFRFEKYIELLQSNISIIANNCWGGHAYHTLGMKFNTPFINMFETDKDYLKLLSSLPYYLALKLKFERIGYNPGLEIEYPICKLGDIELHFNHVTSMNDVEKKWYERVKRINWDNLFIMMITNKSELAEMFDKLEYPKKICFLPFNGEWKSALGMQVAEHDEMRKVPFFKVVNGTVSGEYHDYDLIELLLSGKVNHDRYYII